MNEAPLPPWWKKPLLLLRKHTTEALGVAIAGGILTTVGLFGSGIWKWLLTNIQNYPAQLLCLIALGITTFSVWMTVQHWRASKFALVKVAEVDATAEGLELELTVTKKRCLELEADITALRVPKDRLVTVDRRVVTCILCTGKITSANIILEVGLDATVVKDILHALRYDLFLIKRCGVTNDGQELFELTEQGKQYALEQRIPAIEQGDQIIQQTAADAEANALKEQNTMLFKQHNEDTKKIVALEATISELRKIVPPREMPPQTAGKVSSPFAALRNRDLESQISAAIYGQPLPKIGMIEIEIEAMQKRLAAEKSFPPNHWPDIEKPFRDAQKGSPPSQK